MQKNPKFKVGDLVLIKKAQHTPEIVGQVRKVTLVTDKRVYVSDHARGWAWANPNIDDYLEIVEEAAIMVDTREYLSTITGEQNAA